MIGEREAHVCLQYRIAVSKVETCREIRSSSRAPSRLKQSTTNASTGRFTQRFRARDSVTEQFLSVRFYQ